MTSFRLFSLSFPVHFRLNWNYWYGKLAAETIFYAQKFLSFIISFWSLMKLCKDKGYLFLRLLKLVLYLIENLFSLRWNLCNLIIYDLIIHGISFIKQLACQNNNRLTMWESFWLKHVFEQENGSSNHKKMYYYNDIICVCVRVMEVLNSVKYQKPFL